MTQYEYAVNFAFEPTAGEVHRGPFSEAKADAWIQAGIADGAPDDMFVKVRREVGEWEVANDGD